MSYASLFADLAKQTKAELVRKDEEIDAYVLALLSKHHVCVVGEPGIGKTLGAERLIARISGANYFYRALGAFTAPEHLFGPVSIAGLKNDEQRYVTTGKLPDAHVFVADEWTRAGNAVLSELLQGTNERRFEQAGVLEKMPLMTAIFLCNQLIDEKDAVELHALWDRIMIRLVGEPVTDEEGLRALARVSIDPDPAPVLTLGQLEEAQSEVADVDVPDDVISVYIEMFGELSKADLRPSGRRWREALRLVQAAAWLDGRTAAETVDLEVLADVFWNDPSQRRTVQRIVWNLASPGMKAVSALLDDLAKVQTEVDAALASEGADIETGTLAARKKIKRHATEVNALRGAGPRADAALDDVWRRLQALHDRIMVGLEFEPIPLDKALTV